MLADLLSTIAIWLAYGLILLTSVWSWFYFTNYKLVQEAEKLPSMLPRWPLVGNAPYAIGSLSHFTKNVIWYWEEAARRGIYSYVYWAGPIPLVIVSGAKDIKKLLGVSLHQGPELENFSKEFLGYGLLTAPVDHWKITRRHMNPVFHPNNCKQNIDLYNQNCRGLVSRLSKHVGKEPVDVVEYLSKLALKSVCHSIFGQDIEFDVDSKEFQNFLSLSTYIPGMIIEKYVKFWLRNETVFNLIKGQDLKEKHAIIENFFNVPLKKAQEKYELKKKNIQLKTENNVSGYIKGENSTQNQTTIEDKALDRNTTTEPVTVVEVYAALRESNPNITETHFYQELITACMTGTATVEGAATFVLLLLAQYQDVQEKLYKEISSVMEADDDVSLEDMNRMPYLEQVIKETLRFVQIVPFLTREVKEDVKLTSVTVPAGSTVFMALGGLHMDPNIFPKPEKFDPDRFANSSTAKINDDTFIPYSRGARNCIGKAYAQMILRIIIIHVIRRYHLTTKMTYQTTRKTFVVSMRSDEPVYLSFNYRS